MVLYENNTREMAVFFKLKQIELFYNGAHLLCCLFSSLRRFEEAKKTTNPTENIHHY